MGKLRLSLLFVASVWSLCAVGAAPSCRAIFSGKKSPAPVKNWVLPKPQKYAGKLDPQQLSKISFVQNGDTLVEITHGQNEVVGRIQTIDAKYLFEWAHAELHASFVNYGITSEQM